jgi:amidohydrolase
MADRLRELIREDLPRLVELRHDLHRHPELADGEQRTSQAVQRELSTLGVAFKAGYGKNGTGVVAHLPPTDHAAAGRPATALRADMDALPIEEQTGKPYASTRPGVMHACGHDGHTTILLGAARALLKIDRPNPVTLVFQPAEEHGAGASVLCEQGALKGEAGGGVGPPVGRIYGLHGWPQLELGTLASRPGPLLASTDEFEVTVVGVGGHAAYPQLCRDPIVAGAAIVTAIQSLVSRTIAPFESVVCTVGQFIAGSASNIIPESARLVATLRTLSPEVRSAARERLHEIIQRTAEAHGCRAEVAWTEGYPVTHNDPAETECFFSIAADTVGAGRVQRIEHPTMGAEDFSFYGRHVPACFFLLGLKPPEAAHYPALHQPDFDFNDQAIPLGVEMMCRLARAR